MALTYLQVGTWNIKHLERQPTESEQSQSEYALTDHYMINTSIKVYLDVD